MKEGENGEESKEVKDNMKENEGNVKDDRKSTYMMGCTRGIAPPKKCFDGFAPPAESSSWLFK